MKNSLNLTGYSARYGRSTLFSMVPYLKACLMPEVLKMSGMCMSLYQVVNCSGDSFDGSMILEFTYSSSGSAAIVVDHET